MVEKEKLGVKELTSVQLKTKLKQTSRESLERETMEFWRESKKQALTVRTEK